MFKTMTGYCEVMGTTLTYTLTYSDGSALDDWMIFNPTALTVQGLVPTPKADYVTLMLSATDSDNFKLTSTFKIYFLSKPYLYKELPDHELRTKEEFKYFVPKDTFKHPNNLALTYNITGYPSWMKVDLS